MAGRATPFHHAAKSAARGLRRGAAPAAWVLVTLFAMLFAAGCGGEDAPPNQPATCDDANMLCTVLGTGDWGFGGEGAPPAQVVLYWPIDLAFDSQNRLLVLDWNNFRVRRLDSDGIVRTILGTGVESVDLVNGSPALQTALHHSFSMGFDGAGSLYLAGNHAPLVIRMDADALVWTVAGSANAGYAGDGGPALEASLDTPCGVAAAPGGFPIYIADTANHCIRAVDSQGVITTIAGDGQPGSGGDGGPAAQSRLSSPYRVRFDEGSGALYVADAGNHKIRRIDASGTITTVAGGASAGYSGDGAAASAALLDGPLDARKGPDGALYIADTNNDRIRRVDAAGIITTVAGSGFEGTRLDVLDSGPPLTVNLRNPAALAFDSDGVLYIADTYNSVVRRVRLQP